MRDNHINLVAQPSWTYVKSCTPFAKKLAAEACSARDPNAWFKKGYKRGFTDGKFHLFKYNPDRFPTGLLSNVIEKMERRGISWDVESDIPVLAEPGLVSPVGIKLRDYQLKACRKAIEEGRGILGLPTASGKSIIALTLCLSYELPTVVLASRTEGVYQLYQLFKSSMREDELATDTDQGKPVVIMTYTKAAKRDLSQYELVISDEVHRVGSKTYSKAVMSCERAYHRFGLSGTPEGREDGKDIFFYAATGPVIYTLHRTSLIDRGYSADAEVYFIPTSGILPTSTVPDNNWQILEDKGIVQWEQRNHEICEAAKRAYDCQKPTLVLIRRIDQGEILQGLLAKRGLSVPFVHGATDSSERDEIYRKFHSGELKLLIASSIYNDSVDVPGVEVLINAAGGKSLIATKQKLGRGLRNPGDKLLTVIDFLDQHHPILARHSSRRKAAYSEEGFKINTVDNAQQVLSE